MQTKISRVIPVILSLVLVFTSVALSLALPGSDAFGQAITSATQTPRPTRMVLPSRLATSHPNTTPAAISPVKIEDDLQIWLSVDESTVRVGDVVTFRLTVENEGDTRVKSLRLQLPLNEGFRIISARMSDGNAETDRGNDTVTGRIKRLDPGDSVTLTVRAQITRDAYDEEMSGRGKVTWDRGYETTNRWRLRLRSSR